MKISNHIHLLKVDFNIQLTSDRILSRFVNVVIVFSDKITLIDTGVKGSENTIFNYIKENGRSVDEIETVILSHSHPDHIGSAARIKELTGCKVIAHEGERDWIENIELQNQQRPVPGFYNLVDRPVKIDEFVSNGQILEFGRGITAEVIHTPGHSSGMLSLLIKEEGILFTGDAIPLKNDIPNYDDFRQLIDSLGLIRKIEFNILLTSWTAPSGNKNEIEGLISEGENYLSQIDKIVKDVYSGEEDEPLQFCRKVIAMLGLSSFLANKIVDRAFRSHFYQKSFNH